MSLHERHLTYDLDLAAAEIWRVFRLTKKLKKLQKTGKPQSLLRGKSLAMIFQKPSTRTRVSFEVAMSQLGGHALNLSPQELQLSRGETIADTARVLSRYVDGIMARVFRHEDIEELATHSSVPVINGLSDRYHPCQALTDYYTIWEKRGTLSGLRLAFVGDGDNNVTNSLLLMGARLGVHVSVGCPKKYQTGSDILNRARKEAKTTGAIITLTHNPKEAMAGADILYTDVWVSMGRTDTATRKKALQPYQVNKALLQRAKRNVLVMHCLPAHREEEITDEVIDGPQSIVFDQAENRLHVQKALLALLLK